MFFLRKKEEKPKEEKPKEEQICVCNHIYCRFVTMDDPKRMTTDVFMKCAYCNETTKISTTGELANVFKYGRF